MVWARENLADEGQDIHGIIIAREADASLTTAIKIHPNMQVLKYVVDFKLSQ